MSEAAIEDAQAVVDDYGRKIMALKADLKSFMDEFGRCERWLDGHSYRKCRRLRGHKGDCND